MMAGSILTLFLFWRYGFLGFPWGHRDGHEKFLSGLSLDIGTHESRQTGVLYRPK